MTHFDLCVEVTRWAVHCSWCDGAAPEVNLDARVVCDVLAYGFEPESVRIVEVKRTRADLLADLRVAKMTTKYPPRCNYAYLALGPELAPPRLKRAERQAILAELGDLGLPPTWGVLRVAPGTERGCESLRSARRVEPDAWGDWRVQQAARAVGRSAAWRMVRNHHDLGDLRETAVGAHNLLRAHELGDHGMIELALDALR